ncbi:MAG: T9SS type A sorting domain-containing protein, partial [Candidatus Absconditabacterales bacterium]
IVNPLPKAENIITSLATGNVVQKICNGESVKLTATGGNNYIWGVGLINQNPLTANPSITTTYTVTVTDANGCVANTSATLTVNPLPVINLIGKLGSVCNNANPFIPNIASPSGGNWSGQGISNGKIYPASLNAGKYPETYTYTDVNGCSASKTDTLIINSSPVINFTKIDPMCEGANAIQLLATPIWGTFITSAKLTNGFIFDPKINKAGNYNVAYVASNSFGCSDTAKQTIVVNPLPNVSLTLNPNHICANVNDITLNQGSPAGGVYSGEGVNNGKFYSSLAGIGTFEITYTVTDQNSCTNKATDLLTVNPIPNVLFNQIVGPIYLNTPAFELNEGIPAGGIYSGDGVVAGWFNPASAGVGQHTLTYTYTHPTTGCIGSSLSWVTVLGFNGVEEFQFSNLEIFPNPVKDVLNIKGIKNISKIEIFNSIGQKIFEINNPKSEIQILFGNYDKGLFIIRFNNLYSTKIVKE